MNPLQLLNPGYWLLALALAGAVWGLHVWDKHVAVTAARAAGKNEILALWRDATLEAERARDKKALRLIDNAVEADNAMLKDRAATDRVIAGLRTERDRMRDELAGYAAGRGLSAPTAADTCSARAAALGDGLERTLRAEEDLVSDLESARTDTRRLLDDARAVRVELHGN